LINRVNNTNHNNQTLIIIFLLTPVLVTRIFTTSALTVFAYSRVLKQETNL
jgi:hypothetical protein